MSARRSIPLFRHLAATGVLMLLDLHQRLRRRISRNFLRVAMVLLTSMLVVIILSSLLALIQISRSMQSLTTDSLVGVEAAVDMRAAIRETELDLLRLRLEPDRVLSGAEIEAFRRKMRTLAISYRAGVFDQEDELNAQGIEAGVSNYLRALAPLRDNPRPETTAIEAAIESAQQLVAAVDHGYQYNLQHLHTSADDVGGSTRQALSIANRLGWSFGIFIASIILVYFAYRWLALPEEGDA